MRRHIEQALLHWKNSPAFLPLLLRGARQVGKTFIIENFGRQYFSNIVTINFELQPEYKNCFETLQPENILTAIELLTRQSIIPGKTLLFLDEIQECPNAIAALRYFKEKIPTLHVIGAGSLLEFILNDEKFHMPVGRIQFIYLKPLSFKEFLAATQNQKLIEYLENITLSQSIPEAVHNHLLKLVKEYSILGGMPAVVQDYITHADLTRVQQLQTSLLSTYRHDFGKYATHAQHKYLQKFFIKVPGLIATDFKFSHIDNEMRTRDLKTALEKLCDAGLINAAYATSGSGLPFATTMNEKKMKLFFVDMGLVIRALQLEAQLLFEKDLLLLNKGALAEQFVGQELLANIDHFEETPLFFWSREKNGSQAAVDFLTTVNGEIIPLEVKAGTTSRLKSLNLFMAEKKSRLGVRISQLPLSYDNHILSLPLYLVSELSRLVTPLIKY